MIKNNSNVDVVFMLDCTGSMSSYIDNTKSQMQSIIEACVEDYENKVCFFCLTGDEQPCAKLASLLVH